MTIFFKNSKFLKRYSRKWNCETIFIGGLYTAYKYCGTANQIIAIKNEHIIDRDYKIIEEIQQQFKDDKKKLIVAHLLGVDYCKDNNLSLEGVYIILKKFLKRLMSTNYNLIITSDHSDHTGEIKYLPYIEFITRS